jgi:hypothetical protein
MLADAKVSNAMLLPPTILFYVNPDEKLWVKEIKSLLPAYTVAAAMCNVFR